MRESFLRSFVRLLLVCAMLVGAPAPGLSRQFRGEMTGTITDPSGAAVPGAQITLTETGTNVTVVTLTSQGGHYLLPYIAPGRYRLRIEATGFQALIVDGIAVRVGDRQTLDRRLAIGPIDSTVQVTGESIARLDRASIGLVVERRRIQDLPLADGNPFTLTRLAPGITFTDVNNLRFTRPFDNGGTSSISANGAGSQAGEFTLDGLPNNAAFGRQVAYVPPAEAVEEFKVVTSSFDARHGHSPGPHVDVVTRAGTNRTAGSIYWFNRHEALAANEFFVNANPGCERNSDGQCRKNPLRYHRWGGTLGGPAMLPSPGGLWSGRDRLFYFASYEGLRQTTPATNTFTVPTEAMRRGDFSALLPAVVIYDPATAAVRADGRIERAPFPGNVIPADRISPIGRNYLSYWPAPNLPCADAQCRNNLIASVPRTDHFYSLSGRVDAVASRNNRLFVRYSHNRRKQLTEGWSGEIRGVDPTTSESFRINDSLAIDHVYSGASRWVLNLRGGLTRFESRSAREAEGAFDVSTLGFPPGTLALFRKFGYFPQFNITGFNPNTGGGTLGGALSGRQVYDVYAVQPAVTTLLGSHQVHAGYDGRVYRVEEIPAAHEAGLYEFDARQVATRQVSDSPAAPIGQELAAVLLGLPSGGRIDRNAARDNQLHYHALFVQDDWRVSSRLTVNLGLRWDMETAPTERHNRNIRGFDATAASPIEAAARAAYAASPIPQVPLEAFHVRGGLLYATEDTRGFYEADTNNVQPRIGFAYDLNSHTLLRGGFAVYSIPFYIDAVNQTGFSQSTLLVPTLDSGRSFRADLANPFPDGVLEPPGAALGLATSLGQAVSFVPIEREATMARRYVIGLQRELPGAVVLDVAFVRNENDDVRVAGVELNPVPRQYLTTAAGRDPAVDSFLSAQVPNPFRGLLPGTGLNGATLERQQLLRPFPQFTSVVSERYDGDAEYNSVQLRVERRFAQGYTVNGTYTLSRLTERASLLNPTDGALERRRSRDDYPHRLVVSGIYEIPVGKGRRFLADAGTVLQALLGGFQVQGVYQYQSGRPLAWGNVAFFGDPGTLRTDIRSGTASTPANPARVAFDTSAFQAPGVDIRLRNNIRTFPSTLPGFRSQPIRQLDLSIIKRFDLPGAARGELRVELLNATNTTQFGEPNLDPTSSSFGRVTSQVNLPRNVQIGLRCVF